MSSLKEIVRKLMPPIAMDAYKWLRSRRAGYSTANRQAFLRLNKGAKENEIVLRPGLRLNILPESRVGFEYFCYRNDECCQEMNCFLELANGKTRLLDVGALHGVFSLAFAGQHEACRALAIEPSAAAFSGLLYNIHKNPACHVEAHEIALADREGTISMRVEGQHLVASGSPEAGDRRCAPIEACTGDRFCTEEEFLPDMIKVDIEGYEYECFQGLRKTIDRGRPIIFLELHPEMLHAHGHSPADIAAFFSQKSYQFYDLNRQPLDYSDIERSVKGRRLLIQPMELRAN